ncbi:hypothetical protein Tco_0265111 [Tanacetum coccineum]
MSSSQPLSYNIDDVFPLMNILYLLLLVSSVYFPSFSGEAGLVQAFYAKELPISPLDPITSPAILTLSLIIKLQKKRLGQKDKIACAHYRISDLEQIIEKI